MVVRYINEFIYFDMKAGIERVEADEFSLNGYSYIGGFKEITESCLFEGSSNIQEIIANRLNIMEYGVGQCIKLEDLGKVYVAPCKEVIRKAYREITSTHAKSNEATALDKNYKLIRKGSLAEIEYYIKDRMRNEGYINDYYIINKGIIHRIYPSISKEYTNEFSIVQNMYRYILFGLIEDNRVEEQYL